MTTPIPLPPSRFDTVANLCNRWRYRGHFFLPDTMRFWRSRVDETAYLEASGEVAYFVTSERPDPALPRTYRVRRFRHVDPTDSDGGGCGRIDTVAEYATKAAAVRCARRLAAEGSAE